MKTRLLFLFVSFLLLSCTLEQYLPPSATPTSDVPLLTASQVYQDYPSYRDQWVRLQGFGVIEAEVPLCPGYVGLDMRMAFVDADGQNLTARLAMDGWEAMHEEELREFFGYIQVFEGDQGCPGSIGPVTVPYFEIVEVRALE